MTTTSASIPSDAAPRAAAVPRARAIAVAALALGVLAQLLFFEVGLGINFPIVVVAMLAAGWLVAEPVGRRPRLADAWLPVAAIGLAAFVAVRGDRTLVALDVLGALALTATSLVSLGGLRVVTRPLGGLLVVGLRVVGAAAGRGVAVLAAARRQLPAQALQRGLGRWGAVLRGLAIALPLLALFAILFSAADAVFAEWTERLVDWDLDLGSVPGRIALALIVAWLAAGTLAFVAHPGADSAEQDLQSAWGRRPRIGSVEVVTALIALDLLFAAFVSLQGAYLFGGRDTLAETGLTYAAYARRGFFELLAVAFAVGALVLGAESFVRRRTLAYRAALIGLVLLTVVVLASAFLRLRLYQDAYGWTELRFYVLAAIVWLALGAAMAVGTIVANRTGWLLHGILALSIAFGYAFNIIGPVRHVAEQNVARERFGDRFDLEYLISLGSDAVPVTLQLLVDRPLPPGYVERVLDEIAVASGLNDDGNRAWQAWNLSRERARELLAR